MPHGISFAFEIENEDAEILKLSSEKHDFSPPLEKQEHPCSSFEYIISTNWRPITEIYTAGQDVECTGGFDQWQRQAKEDLQFSSWWNLMSHARPTCHKSSSGPRKWFPNTTVLVQNHLLMPKLDACLKILDYFMRLHASTELTAVLYSIYTDVYVYHIRRSS